MIDIYRLSNSEPHVHFEMGIQRTDLGVLFTGLQTGGTLSRATIDLDGISFICFLPYSTDLNRIEIMWSKINNMFCATKSESKEA